MSAEISSRRRLVQWAGLIAGPVLASLCYLLLPDSYATTGDEIAELTPAGQSTLALMVWMAVWWLTEAIDVSATALLPIVLLPLTGAASIADATAPYADKLIFLFMGGFILALAMQRWGLDRRFALITLRLVGTRPMNMVAGVMLATAVMSAFVSNTATAAMMLPIALSVTLLVTGGDGGGVPPAARNNFALCMMLGIAYAASIGGIATKIGTPPNGLLLAFIEREYGQAIGFFEWLRVGLPLVAVFLPLTWLLLTRVIYPVSTRPFEGAADHLKAEHDRLGPVQRGEWATFIVFCLTAALWMLRPILATGIKGAGPDEYAFPPLVPGLSDAGIAMLAALALFVIPVNIARGEFAVDWPTVRKMPWGILVLFGGGLSLARAVKTNGVAEFIGEQANFLSGAPTILLVLTITTAVIFLSELTSNTATTATLLPVLAGVALGLDVHPYMLIIPAAVAASCAFMMPVATPPNAIVFGSGYITIPQMCKAGLWLNLLGIVLVTALMYAVIVPLFDL